MAAVVVREVLPEPWQVFSVYVGDELVATVRPADEGVMNWYPAPDFEEPEELTIEEIGARAKSLGHPVTFEEL